MRYNPNTLRELKDSVNPVDILSGIGGIPMSDIVIGGDEIRCPCPLHGGDNKSAFSWKKSTNTWMCFSRGCGSSINRDVFGFVSLKLGIPFRESVLQVARLCGKNILEEADEKSEIDIINKKTIKFSRSSKRYKLSPLKELSFYPGYIKSGFPLMLKYLESRGYNYETLDCFKLYPSKDSFGLLRLGIPVFDEFNKIVGINSRLMDTVIDYPTEIKGSDDKIYPVPKYRLFRYNKNSILYNLNNAKDYSLEKGLIVVEGQFDVIRLHTYGFKNTVCTMGTTISSQQTPLLYKYCYHVIFLVEEGKAAEEGVLKSIKELQGLMKISIARLPSGDADSNTKEVIEHTLNNAIRLSPQDVKEIVNGTVDHLPGMF